MNHNNIHLYKSLLYEAQPKYSVNMSFTLYEYPVKKLDIQTKTDTSNGDTNVPKLSSRNIFVTVLL